MMKIFLRGLALVALAAASPTVAADLAPTYKAAPAVMTFNWTGFYVGGNAGWAGSASSTIVNTGTDAGTVGLGTLLAGGAIPGVINVNANGFIGGGQVGYNRQAGNWVFGLEADIDGSTTKGSATAIFPGSDRFQPMSTGYNRELDWLATFRGRVGVTATPSFLLYATGGLAVGETKIGNSFTCALCGPPTSTQAGTVNQTDNTSVGWTVGAGAEWMFAPNWSVKAEYLYVDLGRHNSTIAYIYSVTTNSTLTSSVRDTWNIARVGINYKFGGPVAAKY